MTAKKPSIRGVVFDMDHTLYNRKASDDIAILRYMTEFRENIAPDWTDEKAQEAMWTAESEGITAGWSAIVDSLMKKGFFRQAPEVQSFCDWFQRAYATIGQIDPGVYPMLQRLQAKGLQLGIITNGNPVTQQAKLNHFGFPRIISNCLIATGENAKPRPQPFFQMAEALGCTSETLLYVGDNPINDVAASYHAGYIPVWVCTFPHLQPPADISFYTIDHVYQLPDLLKREWSI